MPRPLALALALCSLAATPARADLSYSYLEGSLFANETDTPVGDNLPGKGGDFLFSYGVLKLFHVFGGAKYFELDDYPASVTTAQAGAGVNYNPSPLTSIYFDVAAVSSIAYQPTPTGRIVRFDDDGYTYLFGWREANKPGRMEFNLSAQRIEYNKANTADTWVNLGFVFRVTPRFKMSTALQFGGDENVLKVGVRYYLPNRFDKRRD
jgi:hypothetical protein